MDAEELSKLTDDELERRIAYARPNSYVPSSIYHVYMAEQEKRKHNSILQALAAKQRLTSGKGKKKLSPKVIKILFARSGNICTFPDCSNELINEQGMVTGHIAHIEAEKPGGPRYNKKQADEERFGYVNLILLCPTHHTLVDQDSKTYTVEALKSFKKAHESRNNGVVLNLSFKTQRRTQSIHEYELEISLINNSRKSISKPKLKITMPEKVIKVISSGGKKTVRGEVAEVYFEELDVSIIHPGEEKRLMQTSNIGIIYFLNSDLYDNQLVMNQPLKVDLYADSFGSITQIKDFKVMQEF